MFIMNFLKKVLNYNILTFSILFLNQYLTLTAPQALIAFQALSAAVILAIVTR